MKKYFYSVLAAGMLFASSCSQDQELVDITKGEGQKVTYTVEIPGANESRAIDSDGTEIGSGKYATRLIYAQYETGTTKDATEPLVAGIVNHRDGNKFKVELTMAKDVAYDILFMAYNPDNNIFGIEKSVDTDSEAKTSVDLRALNVKSNLLANQEEYDAFVGRLKEQRINSTDRNVDLYRPFAQVNAITTKQDLVDDAYTKLGIEVEKSSFVIHNAPTTYNVFTGKTSENKNITYQIADMITEFGESEPLNQAKFDGNNDLFYLASVYVLAGEDETSDASTHKGVFQFYRLDDYDNPECVSTVDLGDYLPIQRNHRTNVIGSLLTKSEEYTVSIDANFNDYDHEVPVDKYDVATVEELTKAIEKAQDGVPTTITLVESRAAGSLTIEETINIPEGKIIILDLNGGTLEQEKECTAHYEMIKNNGTLTIVDNSENKEGRITFEDTGAGDANFGWGSYTIGNYGTLTIENGTIEHLGAQNTSNQVVHMYCAIQQGSGAISTTINNGTINTPTYRSVRINHGTLTINGGTFKGQVWMQPFDNETSLIINGGTFEPKGPDASSVFIDNSSKNVTLAITGGIFQTKIGYKEASKLVNSISGGTFATDVTDLIADDCMIYKNSDATFTVVSGITYDESHKTYNISKASGLKWLASEVNKHSNYEYPFKDVTIKLTNDIDLGGMEWTPIGDYRFSANRFCGTFDGQGHTISNFKITKKTDKNDSNKSSYGFFGNLEGTVENLTISNATVNSYAYTGALVGRFNSGLIKNCHVINSKVSNTYWQGGILIGQVNSEKTETTVQDCTVNNSSITSKSAIGAIAGPVTVTTEGKSNFVNCSVINCQVIQNGSFGGSYDNYFGSMFGYLETAKEQSTININNCTTKNTTVKGELNAPISGDFDGNIFINRSSTVSTAEQLAKAIKAGGQYILVNDIAMTEATYQNVDFTLDGNGYTISQAEGSTNTYALFDSMTGKATFKNVKFAGIKGGAVIRTIGTELTMENVAVEGAETTQQQGLFRLMGKSTITNSTFKNNTCSMVITLNYDGANNDPQVVENCVFEDNTCNSTAAVYYVKGAGATINGNKFIGNTVNCTTNGATVYMGFTENNVVTNNLFKNNTVNEANTSSRVAGGVFFGYDTEFTGNAFIGNKVTGENAKGNDVCVSTYYTSINLSGNYWGGNAPIEDTNYFVQHKSDERVVIINDYLTENPF